MSSGPSFGRGDHVRIVPSGTVGQVTHVYRAPGRVEALEYDVVGHDGSRHVVRPGNLEAAPMYVIVERCLGSGSRGPNVYDCHADSDLENVQERAAGRQANAIRCGRPEDTYRVAELRYLDSPNTEPDRRCSIGGRYGYPQIPGTAVYEKPCTKPITHRFRTAGAIDEEWGFRCTEHVAWLDTSVVTVEMLGVRSFGAVGDGVADDTPAIQAAFNSAANSGGES